MAFNKEPKKDYRKRTTHQPNGLPKNLRVEIPVSCYGFTMDGKDYDGTSFIDLMEDLQSNDTFNKISIPIYTKIEVTNKTGKTVHRNQVIGYIREFNTDTGMAVCIIYAKNISLYESIVSPMVVPRVAIKEGKCICIIGLDVVAEVDAKK